MRARVLGAAAGGGFPQWNCACANCAGLRAGTLRASARTQASLAVAGDDGPWLLLGASPDVRLQIERTRELWPAAAGSPIAAVALPNGDVDAWAGLLSLREWAPLSIFATPIVRRDVADDNGVLATLSRFDGHTRWIDLQPGARVPVGGALTLEAVPAPGKPPLHRRRAPDALDNVGFVVRDERRRVSLAWFPSVAAPSPAVERALVECDAVFFDGTFYRDDELQRIGRGAATARQMGHWPVAESVDFVAALPTRDKWLVHVNNTNPLLVDDGPERRELRARGVDVAHDGLGWQR